MSGEKKKNGRPSKFGDIDMKKVEAMLKSGMTDKQMAISLEIAESTWHKWKLDHPSFSESLRGWKASADDEVERSLYERACGYSHPEQKIMQNNGEPVIVDTVKHYPPDSTAMIFWLKNRKRDEWRDRHDLDVNMFSKMSEEELMKRLNDLQEKI